MACWEESQSRKNLPVAPSQAAPRGGTFLVPICFHANQPSSILLFTGAALSLADPTYNRLNGTSQIIGLSDTQMVNLIENARTLRSPHLRVQFVEEVAAFLAANGTPGCDVGNAHLVLAIDHALRRLGVAC